jgi:hypothetical protein
MRRNPWSPSPECAHYWLQFWAHFWPQALRPLARLISARVSAQRLAVRLAVRSCTSSGIEEPAAGATSVPAMAQPEAYIGGADKLFDANGKLASEGTPKFLQGFVQAYSVWAISGRPQEASF